MAPKMSVPKSSYDQLAIVARCASKLALLGPCVREVASSPSLRAICSCFAERAGIPIADAREITVLVAILQSQRRESGLSPEELFDGIVEDLEQEADAQWKRDHLGALRSSRSLVLPLLQPEHPIGQIQRSVLAAFERPNLFQSAKITTDVRPVFTEGGTSVDGVLLLHTLIVSVKDASVDRQLFLALDDRDVATLREVCERTERQSAVVRERFPDATWLSLGLEVE